MTSFPILDLVAGMIFIYFLMSIVSNAIFEGISSLWSIRAKMLQDWVKNTLPNIASKLLDHTLVNGVSKNGKASSYMDGKNFSRALVELIAEQTQKVPQSLDDLSASLDKVLEEHKNFLPQDFKRTLQLFIIEAKQGALKANQLKTEFELYHEQVEKWFDSMMQRVGGKYKRQASLFTFIIAMVASFALNIDSIAIAKFLYANDAQRQHLAEIAYAAPSDPNYIAIANQLRSKDSTITQTTSLDTVITVVVRNYQTVDTTKKTLATLIPIGWNCKAEFALFKSMHKQMNSRTWLCILFIISKFFGLMITVFATCLGAPFWFDVLGRVANLRSSLKPKPSPDPSTTPKT